MAPRADHSRASRAVHVVADHGVYRIESEDGEVGGIFVSRDAAVRFAEAEFCRPQGRALLDETTEG